MISDSYFEYYVKPSIVGKPINIGYEMVDRIIKVISHKESIIHYYNQEPILKANYLVKCAETEKGGILALRYHFHNGGGVYYYNEKLNLLTLISDDSEWLLE